MKTLGKILTETMKKTMNEDQVKGMLKGEQWETEKGEVYTMDKILEEIDAIPSTNTRIADTKLPASVELDDGLPF
jgi:hypothetical protein